MYVASVKRPVKLVLREMGLVNVRRSRFHISVATPDCWFH